MFWNKAEGCFISFAKFLSEIMLGFKITHSEDFTFH